MVLSFIGSLRVTGYIENKNDSKLLKKKTTQFLLYTTIDFIIG